jgi:hypothetical protein
LTVICWLQQVVCWASLPGDVIIRLLRYLPLQELCSASASCQAWHAAAQAETIWHSLLQRYYQLAAPPAFVLQSSQQYFRQLHTSAMIYCGVTPFFTAPGNTAAARPDTSSNSWHQRAGRSTEPCHLWSNHAGIKCKGCHNSTRKQGAAAEQLQLPRGFSVAAIAAGTAHLVLLSPGGQVIDTRVNWTAAPEQSLVEPQYLSGDQTAGAAGADSTHGHAAMYLDDEQANNLPPLPGAQALQMPRAWSPPDWSLPVSSIAAGE